MDIMPTNTITRDICETYVFYQIGDLLFYINRDCLYLQYKYQGT